MTVAKAELRIINNIPPEYMALSELMYACGSKTLCGACFGGKLHAEVYGLRYEGNKTTSTGCCGRCKNLSIGGCVQKPVGCAGFVCHGLALLIPHRIYRAVRRIQDKAFRDYRTKGFGCYSWTMEEVLAHAYTLKELERFRTATARVEKLTRWVKKNFKPNWPLVARITKADEGALG